MSKLWINPYDDQMKLLTVIVFACVLAACNANLAPETPAVPITPIGPGSSWLDPATWGGKLPDANSSVTIPAGKTITLDTDASVRDITVLGALTFADKDLSLAANWIMVHGPGVFQVSKNGGAFTKRLTITLKGSNPSEDIMGMGTKFLGAMMGGKLEIIGEDRVSWTQLGANTAKGASTITLKENVDWRAGERIVIASSSMNPDEAEVRTITAVNGASVTLDRPLSFAHFGQLQSFDGKTLDERAEVGLLSRNIVIQGDEASTTSKFGGHVMVMGSSANAREMNPANRSSAKIRGVEFRRLGQFDRLGRYPFHWHRNGDSTGDFLEDSSVHGSLQRGVVVHGTDGVLVKGNVVFNTPGHSYIVEDGSEQGNTFDRNLGLLPQSVRFTAATLKDQNDKGAAVFWLRTPAGTYTNNSAAGGPFAGYWFDMNGVTLTDGVKAMLRFEGNTVHSHRDGRLADTEAQTWAVWQDSGSVAYVGGALNLERLTAYKNGRAVEIIGRGVVSNAILADNGKAVSQITLRDSTVVSRSANTDTQDNWGEIGMFAYGGYGNAERVTWVGFKRERRISTTLACGVEYPRFSNKGAKLIDSDPSSGCGDVVMNDLDGSLSGTGKPQKLVWVEGRNGPQAAENNLGLFTSECRALDINRTDGVAVCPDYDYRTLRLTYPGGPTGDWTNNNHTVGVVRDEDGFNVTPAHFRWVAYVIPGKTYRLEVKNAKNTSDPTVYPLETLSFITLGLSTGDLSDPDLKPGGVRAAFDPAWATRSLTVHAPAPAGTYRIYLNRCTQGHTCDTDPSDTWDQITASPSLAMLQATMGSGYAVEGGRIYFKLVGGERLRFER